MDPAAPFKRLLRCLLLLCLLTSSVIPTQADEKAGDNMDLAAIVKKIKKGALYFTDCTIDQLAEFCTAETMLNFECFRTIGKCIPGTIRMAMLEGEDTESEDMSSSGDEL
ncbi:uncharacterized protein BcabD6B2_24860 [Babesia caballi]|uniref:Membrane protein, putative n=1 Tax=Babesia caballi TaxID=5871 RepID=A0AAV4LT83_BABCB|nr:membrane protein, putative [Babesia caballi]